MSRKSPREEDKDLYKDREKYREREKKEQASLKKMPPAKGFKDLPRSSIVSVE